MTTNSEHDPTTSLAAIVLAAGRGSRMDETAPKVALPVAGRPMVSWVVDAARLAGADPVVVVIGHGGDHVRSVLEDAEGVAFAPQDQQLGTGHAAACGLQVLDDAGDVLVLAGDGPLVREETLRTMLDRHRATVAAATLATAVLDDPSGYGRILRDDSDRFLDIVEDRNATDEQRCIAEVYPSYACFDRGVLRSALSRLAPDPDSGEQFLTTVPAMLLRDGLTVEIVDAVPPEDVLSINTPEQLAEVDAILSSRTTSLSLEERR